MFLYCILGNFELQARVINKPYDVFGTWYNDSHLVSGSLHWTGQLQSCSVLWLNKVSYIREIQTMELSSFVHLMAKKGCSNHVLLFSCFNMCNNYVNKENYSY